MAIHDNFFVVTVKLGEEKLGFFAILIFNSFRWREKNSRARMEGLTSFYMNNSRMIHLDLRKNTTNDSNVVICTNFHFISSMKAFETKPDDS